MELIKPGTNFDFIGKRHIAYIVSLILAVVSIASLIYHGGPNYGIDFTGGHLIQVKFDKNVTIPQLKECLKTIGLTDAIVQNFSGGAQNEYIIRLIKVSEDNTVLAQDVKKALTGSFGAGSFEIRRIEMVGPKVGKDLQTKALWAVILACGGILIYVAVRFEIRFAVGAVLALAHDALIVIGAYSITNMEVNLPIVAAVLTVIGYSVNDTIVVFDRIRENTRKAGKAPESEVMNRSINETLSRTVITVGVTLLAVLALLFLGGGVVSQIAFGLTVGFVLGCYSSIFVASPLVLEWSRVFPAKGPGRRRTYKR
jgi:preprotein translocase subunit SecF